MGGKARRLFLEQETADPDVASVSLGAARSALRAAFRDLPKLARELEKPKPKKAAGPRSMRRSRWSGRWRSTRFRTTGVDLRPRLPFNGPRDFTGPEARLAARHRAPLSTILEPIALDPLTVADDPNFLAQIAKQPNVPEPVRTGLAHPGHQSWHSAATDRRDKPGHNGRGRFHAGG